MELTGPDLHAAAPGLEVIGADLDVVRSRLKLQFQGGFAQRPSVHVDGGPGGDGTETDSGPVGGQGNRDVLKAVAALHVHIRCGRQVAFAADLDVTAARRNLQGLYCNGPGRPAVDENFGSGDRLPLPPLTMSQDTETAGESLEGQPDLPAVVRADLEAVLDIAMAGEGCLEHIGPRPQEVMTADAGGDPAPGEREAVRGGVQVDRHLARRDHEPQGPRQCRQERPGCQKAKPGRRPPDPFVAAPAAGTERGRRDDDRLR